MKSIQVQNLTKKFSKSINFTVPLFGKPKVDNSFTAVDDISFEIEEGEFVGFIGPNGAGKTTTLKMLSGILIPTSGSVKVLGFNPVERDYEFLKQISIVMGNKYQINGELPAIDTFDLHRVIYKIDKTEWKNKIDELVNILDLEDKIHTQFKKLSLGQKMKCELILALLHNPKVLFLDEPTIGLDIISQKNLRDFLKKINKEDGTTIILTSHYMEDVEELCSRVIMINHGKKLFDDSLDQMMKSFSTKKNVIFTMSEENGQELYNYLSQQNIEVLNHNEVIIEVAVEKESVSKFISSVLNKFEVSDISINETSLEEIVRDLYVK